MMQRNALDTDLGIVWEQISEQGEEHLVLYISRKLKRSERKYCTTEKECFTIVYAVKMLRYYLDGHL